MSIVSSIVSPVANRIISFPIDPSVGWCLVLGTLLAYAGVVLVLDR